MEDELTTEGHFPGRDVAARVPVGVCDRRVLPHHYTLRRRCLHRRRRHLHLHSYRTDERYLAYYYNHLRVR